MGLFKQLKDMKQMTEAAPDMIRQARQMGAQAQEMAAAQQAAAQMQMASAQAAAAAPGVAGAGAGELEPIAGVSLELYAQIAKGLAAYNYDQTRAPEVAASMGVDAASYAAAMEGWNARMKSDPSIAKRFNALYTGRA